jgi:uncharacterized protein YheU (UPF0270 family)
MVQIFSESGRKVYDLETLWALKYADNIMSDCVTLEGTDMTEYEDDIEMAKVYKAEKQREKEIQKEIEKLQAKMKQKAATPQ